MFEIACGLVVKGGKEFIDKWKNNIPLFDMIFVIDNGADKEVKEALMNNCKVKQYLMQNTYRNSSRDYQKLLNMAREEKCKWIWMVDIDEEIIGTSNQQIKEFLINNNDESGAFPLVEMRNDENHYVTYRGKDARGCHKVFKPLSHFKYDLEDTHGSAIPPNCNLGNVIPILIKHYGHMTKEMREKKRKQYIEFIKKNKNENDVLELEQVWFKEELGENDEIRDINELIQRMKERNEISK